MALMKRKENYASHFMNVKKAKNDQNEISNHPNEPNKTTSNFTSVPKKADRVHLSEEDLTSVRAEIKMRQKAAMECPKIFLKLEDEGVLKRNDQPCIFTTELQHLLLYALQKHQASTKARWCHLLRPNKLDSVLLLVVENVAADDFKQHQQQLKFLDNSFPMRVDVVNPGEYSMKLEEELFSVAMSHRQMILNSKVLGSKNSHIDESFSRVDLMLDSFEMMIENYPMPNRDASTSKFKFTKDKYDLPTEKSRMFGVDCEMVETSLSSHELAWVSVVDEELKCVYESLVKPKGEVTNYLTKYSGITQETLLGVTNKLRDVQKALRIILPPDAILVGQSLNYDLKALRMYHPFVIDTSCIFNLSGHRFKKPKLQLLSTLFIRRDIQRGVGHDPREDAEAAMQLVLLKLKNGITYGNVMQGWKVGELEMPKQEISVIEERCVEDSRFKEGGSVSNHNYKGFNGEFRANVCGKDDLKEDVNSDIKSVFFRSNKYCLNLFKHFIAENKNVSLVNFAPDLLAGLYDEESGDQLKVISLEEAEAEEKDKVAMRRCREQINQGKNFLNVVKFQESSTYLLSDCKNCFKRCLKDKDSQIKKLYNCLPQRSLMIVLLTGRGSGDNALNGLCFVKIKLDV